MASGASEVAAAASSGDSAHKLPPPEKPSDVRRRSYILLSMWLLIVFLGLPIWWYTTTIHRANLPEDRMLEWADGKACRPVFPLQISFQADELQATEAEQLVRMTQHALDDQNEFSGHHLRLQYTPAAGRATRDDLDLALTIKLTPGETQTSKLDPLSASLQVTYPPNAISSPNSGSGLATYIATQLQDTFAEEQSIISYLLSTSSMASGSRPQTLTPSAIENLSKRTTRSVKYAPTYHLTFSLFTDGPTPNTWDIEDAVDKYISPMLDLLRPIHNFTVDTQLQLYATPGVQSHLLNNKDLPSFINAAEWPLSPSIGGAPTINFVLFVGNQTISDVGSDATSQSWLIPQWGSVYLLSLPDSTKHVSSETLRQSMLTFSNHLLTLLGTPQFGSLPLRLSTLMRIRSADLLLRASSTLGSLARLTNALPSIAIPSTVADGVARSMDHLSEACTNLGGSEGLLHARIAEEEAERAFFEKSMVGQLYFPDEHKVAVYLPLLGPVGVPLVMGLVKELKNWLRKRKEKKAAGQEKKSQ